MGIYTFIFHSIVVDAHDMNTEHISIVKDNIYMNVKSHKFLNHPQTNCLSEI